MVGMQDKDAVQRARQHRIRHILFGRHAEHHVHEIFRVTEFVLRIHERRADVIFVRHRGDGRHFRQHAHRRQFAVFRVFDVQRVVIEGRQCPHHADHHCHRVRIAAEAVKKARKLFVHHGVPRHSFGKSGILFGIGQFAIQQQIAHFQKIRWAASCSIG